MKKLTILLLFTSLFGYAQIDYEGLIKNLEKVTYETDINDYLKGLPYNEEYSEIEFNDERFLRFHKIIISKVKFSSRWSGKIMTMTPFNEKENYEKIKAKLIALYGDPEINNRRNSIEYEWKTDTKDIDLKINTEDEDKEEEEEEEEEKKQKFISFEYFTITFKQV